MNPLIHTYVDDLKNALVFGAIFGVALYVAVKAIHRPQVFVALNVWVGKLATTNWKMFIGGIMALGTMGFYFGSEIRCIAYKIEGTCRPIDTTNFGLWLAFVAAWAGISVQQFKIKRDTYAAPSPDSERASVPASPPPATPSQPPGGGGDAGTSSTTVVVTPLAGDKP